MQNVLLVGLGGFIGSVSRFLVSGWVQGAIQKPLLPFGTLMVNVLGCLLIGFLSGLADMRGVITPRTRAMVMVGMLGGFTTFSTFGYETFALGRDGQTVYALANVGTQVLLGLAAVWLGYAAARLV